MICETQRNLLYISFLSFDRKHPFPATQTSSDIINNKRQSHVPLLPYATSISETIQPGGASKVSKPNRVEPSFPKSLTNETIPIPSTAPIYRPSRVSPNNNNSSAAPKIIAPGWSLNLINKSKKQAKPSIMLPTAPLVPPPTEHRPTQKRPLPTTTSTRVPTGPIVWDQPQESRRKNHSLQTQSMNDINQIEPSIGCLNSDEIDKYQNSSSEGISTLSDIDVNLSGIFGSWSYVMSCRITR